MHTIRPNAIRVKRFRELKADLRTKRDRLLVGIDIAKAQHVAQVRLAHTQIVDKSLALPNTQVGLESFWAHLAQRRAETGVSEIVCALEPTGTYHQALATFLEAHGVDVVLVCNHVAALNRRTLDRTWGKSDPKDAHNLCDLLERGHVLFYSLPDERIATLRRLVRLLRLARTELGACQARFRNTLLPLLGPAGEPLPPVIIAALPAPLQLLLPAAQRRALPAAWAELPPALAFELTALAARLVSVRARLAQIAAELVRVAQPLPVYTLLRTIPGIGPTLSRPSSSPSSGTSRGTPASVNSGSSPAWTASGSPPASGRGQRGSPGAGGRSCAGRCTRPPSGPRARRSGAPGGPRSARSATGIPTPSSRPMANLRQSSSASCGGSGGAGGRTRRRRAAAAPRPGPAPSGAAAGRGPPRGGRRNGSAGVAARTRNSGEAARACNVEAPGGDLGRDRGAPLPLPQPGLGRQGALGSSDAAYHHYDGARRHPWGEAPGGECRNRERDAPTSRGGIYLDNKKTAGSRIRAVSRRRGAAARGLHVGDRESGRESGAAICPLSQQRPALFSCTNSGDTILNS
jgi:transposase